MGFEAAAVQHALQCGAAGAGKGGFLRAGSAFESRRADVGEMVATALIGIGVGGEDTGLAVQIVTGGKTGGYGGGGVDGWC